MSLNMWYERILEVGQMTVRLWVDAKFLSVKERRARNENSEPIRQAKEESQKKFTARFQMGH